MARLTPIKLLPELLVPCPCCVLSIVEVFTVVVINHGGIKQVNPRLLELIGGEGSNHPSQVVQAKMTTRFGSATGVGRNSGRNVFRRSKRRGRSNDAVSSVNMAPVGVRTSRCGGHGPNLLMYLTGKTVVEWVSLFRLAISSRPRRCESKSWFDSRIRKPAVLVGFAISSRSRRRESSRW